MGVPTTFILCIVLNRHLLHQVLRMTLRFLGALAPYLGGILGSVSALVMATWRKLRENPHAFAGDLSSFENCCIWVLHLGLQSIIGIAIKCITLPSIFLEVVFGIPAL